MSFEKQFEIAKNRKGFIAALDQSGANTPKPLELYGVGKSEYSGEEEMFERVHEMRTRIITSPSFTSNRIIGAILFEKTMRSQIERQFSAQYLWEQKQVIPFLKVDNGLAEENNGVQLMKPILSIGNLLKEAKINQVFGTKMRSVIKTASPSGVKAVVDQQFEIGKQIIDAGLVPILEPEVDINSSSKGEAEQMLLELLIENINSLGSGQNIILKLSLPNIDNHYAPCVQHSNVVRVVALSGGYKRKDANKKLKQNQGITASFSRALTEGLSSRQPKDQFNNQLDSNIESIFQASIT
jgi:fructose-bisphosphate aldolase class I